MRRAATKDQAVTSVTGEVTYYSYPLGSFLYDCIDGYTLDGQAPPIAAPAPTPTAPTAAPTADEGKKKFDCPVEDWEKFVADLMMSEEEFKKGCYGEDESSVEKSGTGGDGWQVTTLIGWLLVAWFVFSLCYMKFLRNQRDDQCRKVEQIVQERAAQIPDGNLAKVSMFTE